MHTRGVLAVAVAACVLPATASANTKTVTAGPPPSIGKIAGQALGKKFIKTYNPDINDFFLHRVTINVGDTVSFQIDGFHTVDLPGSGQTGQPLTLNGATVTGVNDAAGSPFWFNNALPSQPFNPAVAGSSGGHSYDGSHRIESGLPSGSGPPKPFKVKFTKAGKFKFYCDVHAGMVGFVVVKPKGKSVPTAKQDAAALKRQVTADVTTAKSLATPHLASDQATLGQAGANGVELFAFFPAKMTVSAGTTVTYSMTPKSRELHTASVGPLAYLMSIANLVASSPVLPPAGVYPSDPTPVIAVGLTSHGNGFGNTGGLSNSGPPLPKSGKIKFTQAGTYNLICMIHPFMHQTVIVH
jgi:plastocyanin